MESIEATAFWISGCERGELRRETLPNPSPEQVRVRTLFSAISRGTEGLVWRGGVPEEVYGSMRAPFQAGDFPWPVKYGYIAVGTVDAGSQALRGRTVFCLHPHQDVFVVPASALTIIPDDVPPARAVLAANMETAVNAVWDAQMLPGERIAVIGAGVVGSLVAYLAARIPGAQVQLIDRMPQKKEIATALGIPFASPEQAETRADVVFEASGNPGGLNLALRLAGMEARIVALSWFGNQEVSLPLGGAFHARRLKLISSQVGQVPAHCRPRWDHAQRMDLALRLLRDPALDALINGESAFADIVTSFARVVADPSVLCHRIRYR
jgi:2-desacetyl-2-hydroxyethyl bacteriochlorophyllide A dehydrogenase